MDELDKITRFTMVPLGLAVSVIGAVTIWVSRVESRATANEINLQNHKVETESVIREVFQKIERFEALLGNIDRRLSVIEGEVRRIRK